MDVKHAHTQVLALCTEAVTFGMEIGKSYKNVQKLFRQRAETEPCTPRAGEG